MRKAMSIICSIAFAIAGIALAISGTDLSPGISDYKKAAASTINYPINPVGTITTDSIVLPQDLLLGLAKNDHLSASNKADEDLAIIDSLKRKVADLEKATITNGFTIVASKPVVKYKTKTITQFKTDTVKVPVYYIATKHGNRGTPENCTSIYELKEVNKICPETISPSADRTTEYEMNE